MSPCGGSGTCMAAGLARYYNVFFSLFISIFPPSFPLPPSFSFSLPPSPPLPFTLLFVSSSTATHPGLHVTQHWVDVACDHLVRHVVAQAFVEFLVRSQQDQDASAIGSVMLSADGSCVEIKSKRGGGFFGFQPPPQTPAQALPPRKPSLTKHTPNTHLNTSLNHPPHFGRAIYQVLSRLVEDLGGEVLGRPAEDLMRSQPTA